MKVLAAYLLAVLGGNVSPSSDDLKKILSSVGVEADDEMVELLLKQVEGKDLAELIAAGRQKMASVPSGGAAVSASAPVGGASAAVETQEKVEEKVEEEEEEDDFDCIGLFD